MALRSASGRDRYVRSLRACSHAGPEPPTLPLGPTTRSRLGFEPQRMAAAQANNLGPQPQQLPLLQPAQSGDEPAGSPPTQPLATNADRATSAASASNNRMHMLGCSTFTEDPNSDPAAVRLQPLQPHRAATDGTATVTSPPAPRAQLKPSSIDARPSHDKGPSALEFMAVRREAEALAAALAQSEERAARLEAQLSTPPALPNSPYHSSRRASFALDDEPPPPMHHSGPPRGILNTNGRFSLDVHSRGRSGAEHPPERHASYNGM